MTRSNRWNIVAMAMWASWIAKALPYKSWVRRRDFGREIKNRTMQARRPNPKGCHAFAWHNTEVVSENLGSGGMAYATYRHLLKFTI